MLQFDNLNYKRSIDKNMVHSQFISLDNFEKSIKEDFKAELQSGIAINHVIDSVIRNQESFDKWKCLEFKNFSMLSDYLLRKYLNDRYDLNVYVTPNIYQKMLHHMSPYFIDYKRTYIGELIVKNSLNVDMLITDKPIKGDVLYGLPIQSPETFDYNIVHKFIFNENTPNINGTIIKIMEDEND